MNNPLPDLGVELLKKYNKGTFFYFQNFIIGQITFNYQEYMASLQKGITRNNKKKLK